MTDTKSSDQILEELFSSLGGVAQQKEMDETARHTDGKGKTTENNQASSPRRAGSSEKFLDPNGNDESAKARKSKKKKSKRSDDEDEDDGRRKSKKKDKKENEDEESKRDKKSKKKTKKSRERRSPTRSADRVTSTSRKRQVVVNPPKKSVSETAKTKVEPVKERPAGREQRRRETSRRRRSPSKTRSRSRSRSRRRRRSRTASPRPGRSRSWSRRRRRSRSPDRRPNNSSAHTRSPRPVDPLRSRSANRRSRSPQIDKAQLLEAARQNLKRMQQSGSLVLPVGFVAPESERVQKASQIKSTTGKTVEEFTDICKTLIGGDDDDPPDGTLGTGQSGEGGSFTHQRFQVKARAEAAPIVMNIRNAIPIPVRKPEERLVKEQQLKQQFPISSGSQHLDLEWVPVKSESSAPSASRAKGSNTATVAPTPRLQPAPEPVEAPPSVDIGAAVARRLSAIRKLQENEQDPEARRELQEAESMTQTWANHQTSAPVGGSQVAPNTNPLTGEPIPELINWSGAPQAWARRDQMARAAPLSGGVGMKLLQKMGWQPGQGLGRHCEGLLEPLALDIKTDKKGLVAREELAPPKVAAVAQFQGKHPVSALHEICTKKRWEPPLFLQALDAGPDHQKQFLYTVRVNGVDYRPNVASCTKKDAKAQAAALCLQSLGVDSM